MTAVMILFAFALSLVIGYVERTITHNDHNPYARKVKKEKEPEPAHKPD